MTQSPTKQEVRRRISARVASLNEDAHRAADEALCRRALDLLELRSAHTVMAYAPFRDEPGILPILRHLLAAGRALALPRVLPDDPQMVLHLVDDLDEQLTPGAWSIPEPRLDLPTVKPCNIDAIIVPGVAFSPSGERLGRGGGYYDRLLPRTPALRVALCYEEQLVEAVPTEEHDALVDLILTPTRLFRIGSSENNDGKVGKGA